MAQKRSRRSPSLLVGIPLPVERGDRGGTRGRGMGGVFQQTPLSRPYKACPLIHFSNINYWCNALTTNDIWYNIAEIVKLS